MQMLPNSEASMDWLGVGTYFCGDLKRRSPTGGTAKGIPLKARTESEISSTAPTILDVSGRTTVTGEFFLVEIELTTCERESKNKQSFI